jgi:hypothetical protein
MLVKISWAANSANSNEKNLPLPQGNLEVLQLVQDG